MLNIVKQLDFWNALINSGLFTLAVIMWATGHPDNLWKVMAIIEAIVLIHIIVQRLGTNTESEQQGVHHEY